MNWKLKPKYKKYVRAGLAVIVLLLGGVFMIFPFIPLGYLFLFAGVILLVPYVPVFQSWLEYFKKKDKKDRVEYVEKKVSHAEDNFNKKIVREEEPK